MALIEVEYIGREMIKYLHILRLSESDLLLLEKGDTNVKKEKTRMNSVILNWKWKYQCELTVFRQQ